MPEPIPSPAFYLRFKPAEQRKWVRRNLFATLTGWTPVYRFEESTAFISRDEALAFARQYHLESDVELLELRAEAVHAA